MIHLMEVIQKIQNLFFEGKTLYDTALNQFIDEFVAFYQQYPYLLVVLLAFVPLFLFGVFYFIRKIFELIQRRKQIINVDGPYFRCFFQFLLWTSTNSFLYKIFISLESQFEFYEKFIFSILLALSASLMIVNIIKFFSLNAYEQFQSILKKNAPALKKGMKTLKFYFVFYLSFYLIVHDGLGWKKIGLWTAFFGLIHLTRMSETHRNSLKLVWEYLFGRLSKGAEKVLMGPLRLLSYFIILLMGSFYRLVFALSFFELTKKLAAKIIRQQVERVSVKDEKKCTIPEEYNSYFKKLDLKCYKPAWLSAMDKEICHAIDEWKVDYLNESFVHLVGDPGSGRNALILDLIAKYKDLNPLRINIPKKITNKEDFLNFVGGILKNIRKDEEEGENYNKLVIFDNAENLYLNSPSGFDALKEMFRIVNRSENSFFWINIFDFYPWMHIQDFFGHVYHRQKYILKGFKDEEIKLLISLKNKELGYKIVFDKAIYEATSNKGSENQIENVSTHFFRMIWEQSNGNPIMAQELWLKSIRFFSEDKKIVKVGLPERNDSSILKHLGTDALFVYNSLVKHSRMSFEQCCEATNLSNRVVRFALVYGENEKFLIKDENNNFTIVRGWYSTLVSHLKTKNLIYG